MLHTIFTYEWKQCIRNKGMIAALLVFAGIGLFCLQQGKAIYTFQQVAIDSALVKKQRNYEIVKQVFDTLKPEGNQLHQLESPFYLEWKLQDVVAKPQHPLSILSIGQNDIYTPLLSGRFNTDIFKNSFAEFQNPEKLLTGNLDVSYFILLLFPLLFIALCYNIQSADKEAGITPLLNTQAASLNKLVYQRLLFRWLLAWLPVLVIAVISCIQLASLKNFNFLEFAQWWSVTLLYTLFWLALAALVQHFQFTSLINAIVLTGIWVLLLIAIPGLLNTWFNYKYPPTNKTEIAEYRDFDFKAWDKPFEDHKKFMFERYPQYKKLNLTKMEDSVKFRSFSYVLMVNEKEKELYQQVTAVKNKQLEAEEKSFWLNPAGGVIRALTSISNSTLRNQQQFEEATLAYREQKAKFLFDKLVTQPHFTKQDFEAMPKFAADTVKRSVSKYLLPLFTVMTLTFFYLWLKGQSKN
jgi:ABC-2 type transport system permease protein